MKFVLLVLACLRVVECIGKSPYYSLYSAPLPIPPVLQPRFIVNINGTPLSYYELTIDAFQEQVFPSLGPANLVGYNSQAPGPTLRIPYGTESLIRVTNNVDAGAVVHLHGAWSRAPWDGWASETINKDQFKDYYYSGSQSARTLWYHDHANHHTARDAYYGQMGFHIIDDPAEDRFRLPHDAYDIPLALEDKIYRANGDLVSPENEHVNFFGDMVHVNGRPWPYLQVEPRKYRFRFLNAGLSRPYSLFFADKDHAQQIMHVIASDGGLFNAPVPTEVLSFANGERYDIVFDFAPFSGTNVTLGNTMRLHDMLDFDNTDKVMRFVVGSIVTNASNNDLPASLVDQSTLVQQPPDRNRVDHVFNFDRKDDKWTINGADFDSPANRVLARPPAGSVERWTLRYAGGPGVHPVHLHLVDFRVVSRRGGSRGLLPYETAGLKDVVLLEPGEEVDVLARYGPWDGLYMFHCHNLVHEDHEMMDVVNVTRLEALGYTFDEVMAFDDPLDQRFLPKNVTPDLYEEKSIVETLLPMYANLAAYRKVDELLKAEEDWYAKNGYNGDAAPAAAVSSTVAPETSSVVPTSFIASAASTGRVTVDTSIQRSTLSSAPQIVPSAATSPPTAVVPGDATSILQSTVTAKASTGSSVSPSEPFSPSFDAGETSTFTFTSFRTLLTTSFWLNTTSSTVTRTRDPSIVFSDMSSTEPAQSTLLQTTATQTLPFSVITLSTVTFTRQPNTTSEAPKSTSAPETYNSETVVRSDNPGVAGTLASPSQQTSLLPFAHQESSSLPGSSSSISAPVEEALSRSLTGASAAPSSLPPPPTAMPYIPVTGQTTASQPMSTAPLTPTTGGEQSTLSYVIRVSNAASAPAP